MFSKNIGDNLADKVYHRGENGENEKEPVQHSLKMSLPLAKQQQKKGPRTC